MINGVNLADTLTCGIGADMFVYTSTRDAGEKFTDFTSYADTIKLRALLSSVGYSDSQAVADDYVCIVDLSGGASVQIDAYGTTGPATFCPLVTLTGLTAKQVLPARGLGF